MRQNQGRGPEEAERWGDGENATSVRRGASVGKHC